MKSHSEQQKNSPMSRAPRHGVLFDPPIALVGAEGPPWRGGNAETG